MINFLENQSIWRASQRGTEVEYVHRKGKFEEQANRPRSTVMKLLSFKDKEEILKRGKKLEGTKIFINRDFTDNVRQKQIELNSRKLWYMYIYGMINSFSI